MKASLDEMMRGFARFLSASWNTASAASSAKGHLESAEFMSDWLQANWEILVETPFRELTGFGKEFLEPYGEGADCNDSSSRVWNPSALPTHRILCQSSDDAPIVDVLTGRLIVTTENPVVFDHFASKSEQGWHDQAPPFDCVLGYQDDEEVLMRLDQVKFIADKLADS